MLFFVLYPFWFSWYLLVVFLLLLPFDLLLSLPGMFTRRLVFSTQMIIEKGAKAALIVTTVHEGLSIMRKSNTRFGRRNRLLSAYNTGRGSSIHFPARCIKIILRTGREDSESVRHHICSARHDSRYDIEIDTSQSGITTFSMKRMWVVSLLGLFSLPSPAKLKASVLILPPPIKPALTVALPRGVIFRPKPGGGYAEDHDLRQYRQGDPVRSIHWKVSAKFDSLIIREPLIPPPHSRLIIITRWTDHEQRDIILGRVRWISNYLLKWELPFFVKFNDNSTIVEITLVDELENFLYYELSGEIPIHKRRIADSERFSWIYRVDAGARKTNGMTSEIEKEAG
jgi:hypothetical protein